MRKFIYALVLLSGHILWAQENYVDLVWSDEFDIDGAPDNANWVYDIGHGDNGWGNREMQYYTNNAQNVRVEGGKLVIQALKDANGQWTSARLKSQGKRSFTYGRIVWRAKLANGSGTWPALWMLAENVTSIGWPACGEIDVMEHVGKWQGTILSALHTTSSHGDTQNKATTEIANVHTEFHEYELQWSPDKMMFLVDGQVHYTYNPSVKNAANWPFNTPFFLIMNIAMGGGLGSDPQYETGGLKNGIDPALTQARMEIDYVRVYQPFTELTMHGPSIVQKHQEDLRFRTNRLDGATYEWIVPAGATITTGQGTSEISVNWGDTEGNVKAIVRIDGKTYEEELAVTHVIKPQGSSFPLRSDNFNILWTDTDPVNEYHITDEPDATRIDYTVTSPSSAVSLTGTLFRALDLTDHTVMHVRVRSFNRSGTVRMRVDLADERGMITNKSPVFNLQPFIDDGEYFDYSFDFQRDNQWLGIMGDVDPSKITRINLHVDFGVFGSAGSDSLWIDQIAVATPGHPATLPRPSHLSGALQVDAMSLTWKDNSDNEQGFTVYHATDPDGVYTAIASLDANTTAFVTSLGGADPFQQYFKVSAFDADGPSAFSNTFRLEELVTSLAESTPLAVDVYPNPSTGRKVYIRIPDDFVLIRVHDVNGMEKLVAKSVSNPALLDLGPLPAGLYLISVSHKNYVVRRKLMLL